MKTSMPARFLARSKRNSKCRGYGSGQKSVFTTSGKCESGKLPVTGIEIKRDLFDGLRRGWRIFPSHYGLRSILRQNRVAAFDLYLRNGPIGKHGRADPDLSFKMAVLQNR